MTEALRRLLCVLPLLAGLPPDAAEAGGAGMVLHACYDTVVEGRAFPHDLEVVSDDPEVRLGVIEAGPAIVSVQLVINDERATLCRVTGARLDASGVASEILTGWTAASAPLEKSFAALLDRPGVLSVKDDVTDSGAGVEGLLGVRCGEQTAMVALGPVYLSDAGFLFPPHSMTGQDAWTFDFIVSTPLWPALVQEHCA